MREHDPNRQSWRQAIDIPGLVGCIVLILGTYAIFWHYSQTVSGHIEEGELGLDRAASLIWSDED